MCVFVEKLSQAPWRFVLSHIAVDWIFHLFQIREKNMYKTVDKTIYKQAFSPEALIRCWEACLDKSSFHSRRMHVDEFNRKNYWKKKGLAIIPMKFSVGFAATSYHQVRLTCKCMATLTSDTLQPWSARVNSENVIIPTSLRFPSVSMFNTEQQRKASMVRNSTSKHESCSSIADKVELRPSPAACYSKRELEPTKPVVLC